MKMMRSLGISLLSLFLTTAVITNAYYQKKQFYPSVVYITKSNPSMAVIYMQAFICVWLIGKIMRRIFFGQLRTAEFEHLMERSWYAVTETCLAFTVFRDDFNPKFVALFTLLLFLKSFHWLAEDRVDYMERSPVISLTFHLRVFSLLLFLGLLDFYFIQLAYQSTITKGASVQLVFGFEYAILLTVICNIAIKYALHSVDLNSETPWENKAVFLLYTELVMGFIKVVLYISFVAIMMRIYTLPLFAVRPMYYTIRNFKKAFSDVILSRRAIHNMNTLYPDATPEELQAADNVCIICREEMTTASKKLPCNHIFHTSCLRSWFQRQQTCPTCRLNILRSPPPTEANRGEAGRQPMQQPPVNVFFNFAAQNPFRFFNQPNNGADGGGQQQQQAPNRQGAQEGPGVPPNQQQRGSSGSQQPPQMPNAPPFAFPPFPYFPFMVPPPMPPQNLQSLSPEELRRMEGNERGNVEARIRCLRNIQIMLDAAMLMMQQYSAAVAVSSQMPSSSTATTETNTSENVSADVAANSSTANASTSNSVPSSPPEQVANSDTKEESNDKKEESLDDKISSNPCKQSDKPSKQVDNENTEHSGVQDLSSTPEEEVRRRRLQKFQQNSE